MEKITSFLKKNTVWPYIIFAVLILISYANAFHAPFLIDDKAGIKDNPAVGQFSSIYKYPVSAFRYLILNISYSLGQYEPFAYRIFNILFHFGTVASLYLVAKRLINKNVAFLAGVIFAVHPLLTESVTWISAVTYPQYAFFFMASLYFYIRASEDRKWTVASYVFFLLAMLSSEKAVSLPPVLVFLELSQGTLKKNWKRIIPYAVITAAMGGFLLTTVGSRIQSFQKDYYISPQFYNPIEHIPYATTFYAQLFAFPKSLTVYHSELSISIQEFLLRWLAFIVAVVTMVMSYSKNRQIFFWISFYFIALVPSLIPLNIVWVVAERYAYLSIVGLAVITGMLLGKVLRYKSLQTASYAIVTLIVLVLMGLTILRNVDWLSAENLWTSTIAASPHSSNAHNNMGDVYAQRQDYVNAAREFQRAIELQPGDADPRHNLGIALTILRKYPEAADAYLGALQIEPTLYKTNQNLGVVYYTLKLYPEAEEYLSRALKYGPPNPAITKLLQDVRNLQGK
jgi:Tfp pilus assembly protein PilF